jgi:hypothetical protein
MSIYRFALHGKDGNPVETLGALPLSGDAESVTFAEGVIRDMTRAGGAAYHSGWIIDITEGGRGVGSVPFAPTTA